MAKLTAQEFIDAIKEMTVLELNDLVKACEEEFGVSLPDEDVSKLKTVGDITKYIKNMKK